MRDRLIELLMNVPRIPITVCGRSNGKTYQTAANIADHLLTNGVVVPLLQTGQTVYRVSKGRMWEVKVWKIEVCGKTVSYIDDYDKSFLATHIGKGVFLTREEAGAKLKEGKG